MVGERPPPPRVRRWRRGCPSLVGGICAASALTLVLTLGGDWLTTHERALLIHCAGRAPAAREVVVVDLERWPLRPTEFEQIIVSVTDAHPSVVVLDVLADDDGTLASWVDEGVFEPALLDRSRTLLVVSCDWAIGDKGPPAVVSPRRPPPSLADFHQATADLTPPERLDRATPIMAARQVWRTADGTSWLGAALAATLLHRGVDLPTERTLPPGVDTSTVHIPRTGSLLLDGGALWFDHVPSEDDFVVIRARDVVARRSEVDRALAGKIVVVGLVRSVSPVDWHLTPGGWRRGAILHAAQAEQALAGRSYLPMSSLEARLLAALALVLAALVAHRLEPVLAGLATALGLSLVVTLAAAGLRGSVTLVPLFHVGTGAVLGLLGVGLARAHQVRRDLHAFRFAAGDAGDPVAPLLRRVYFLCSLVNERVKVGTGPARDEAAAGEQRKAGYVFQHSDRVLRRFAAMDWETGTWRGVRDVVELVYQGVYEGSGALKRVPQDLKEPGSTIFVVKQLRNYFAHSHELDPRVRARIDGWLADVGAGIGVLEADAGRAPSHVYVRVQVALLNDVARFLEDLDRYLEGRSGDDHAPDPP